ncbi:hypothetical protein [Sphingomonas colocasiae]|uniref:Tryptophan-rich sensory protein n=1 Tax=Sphingomonas colocasiae TaxID=1848973 RepID=A0ABS7PPP4_9SPHN|nr:hypothetical protein [Sphingomonas colocasiae]MBY8823301.1 hypothetical protein [Sphingomonas colocasiae]MBY8826436.1 hypothetical protein [Sphingomonas colocasiae]
MTGDSPDFPAGADRRSTAQRLAIALLAVAQILVTLLPAAGLGEPIGDRSDGARTLITPAGWTFSIWGLLYAGSLAYAVYQLLPAQRRNALIGRIGWASAGAFLGNAAWALYVQFVALDIVSVAIIVATLSCLLDIYRVFSAAAPGFSRADQMLVVLPLSALAAWLTAATIVNIAAVLGHSGLEAGEAAPMLGGAVILAGGLIASAAIWRGHGNPWFAIVFLWALAGIHGAGSGRHDEIMVALALAAIAVTVSALGQLASRENRHRWLTATTSARAGGRR